MTRRSRSILLCLLTAITFVNGFSRIRIKSPLTAAAIDLQFRGSSWSSVPESRSESESSLQAAPLATTPLALLAATGAFLGPVVDGIHNSVLLSYDFLPVQPFGLFHTSLLIPPLLAIAYALLGGVLPMAIAHILQSLRVQLPSEIQPDAPKSLPIIKFKSRGLQAATTVTTTIAIIALSRYLHEDPSISGEESLVLLSFVAIGQWAFLDGTTGSFILAFAAAIGGPIAEIPLMVSAHTWHYLTPDYFPLAFLSFGAVPEAGLERLTGPCYFAVTTDAIALYRFFYDFTRAIHPQMPSRTPGTGMQRGVIQEKLGQTDYCHEYFCRFRQAGMFSALC